MGEPVTNCRANFCRFSHKLADARCYLIAIPDPTEKRSAKSQKCVLIH